MAKDSEKKRTILFCSVLPDEFYKSRRELVCKFLAMNYRVVFASPGPMDRVIKEFEGKPVSCHEVFMSRTGVNPLNDLKTLSDLRDIMRRERPDRIYAFGGAKAAIYAPLAAAMEKIPEIFCMINGLGSVLRGETLRTRLIAFSMRFLFRTAFARTCGVLFQNIDDLKAFVDWRLVKPEKCHIVNGSGVNLNLFSPAPLPDADIFLLVGRLLKDKGIYEFIGAAEIIKEKYPDAEFWIVGPYDTNPTSVKPLEMEDWVSRGLVKYYGVQDSVLPFYQDCSVFVLPSYHEGTPRTSLEAMAVGRPVITTDAPGCRETVIDGETGFLVPVKNVDVLAKKMEFFILSKAKIFEMGQKAYYYAKEKYDVNKVNQSITDFMDKALEGGASIGNGQSK